MIELELEGRALTTPPLGRKPAVAARGEEAGIIWQSRMDVNITQPVLFLNVRVQSELTPSTFQYQLPVSQCQNQELYVHFSRTAVACIAYTFPLPGSFQDQH